MDSYLAVLHKYAEFTGRSTRREYWMYTLVNLIIYVITLAVIFILGHILSMLAVLFTVVYWLYAIAVIIPGFAVSIRRLHDINKSGWWLLLALIPIIGALILLYFMASAGDVGDNQYGPDPKTSFTPVSPAPSAV